MNLKKAKRLRKMARGMSVGKPACRYIDQTHTRTKDGKEVKSTQVLLFVCTRLVYKRLKALYEQPQSKV